MMTDSEKSVIVLTPEDDTVDLMKSRIHQQSELISMMKKRSDGMILELASQEKAIKLLEETRAKLEQSLSTKEKDYRTLKDRFEVLSHNHDEMIKLKNEYKDEIKQLRLKNKSLLDSRSDLSSIEESLKASIKKLHEDLSTSQAQNDALCEKCANMEQDTTDQKNGLKSANDEILSLKKQLEEKEANFEELRRVTVKLQEEVNMHKRTNESLEARNTVIGESLQSLNSLHAAVTEENAVLSGKIKIMEEELGKIRSESLTMSQDSRLQLLRNELEQIRTELRQTQQEYSAYQEFASKRLKEEMSLNEKLRHLAV